MSAAVRSVDLVNTEWSHKEIQTWLILNEVTEVQTWLILNEVTKVQKTASRQAVLGCC